MRGGGETLARGGGGGEETLAKEGKGFSFFLGGEGGQRRSGKGGLSKCDEESVDNSSL